MILPPQGLVDIDRSRRREEALASMMERVKTTQNAMERIYWEKKTEHRDDPMSRHHHYQRRGTGVKDSMTTDHHDTQGDQGKFIRCAISEVLNDIKSEETDKANRLSERRETARRNTQRREDEERRMTREDTLRREALREKHRVKSIDTLGTADSCANEEHTPFQRTNVKKNTQEDDDMFFPCHTTPAPDNTPRQLQSILSETLQVVIQRQN